MNEINNEKDLMRKALLKKACGYEVDEVIEEFSIDDDGVQKLSKKRVTKKHFAPDISALKILIEMFYPELNADISSMSDEELLAERDRILKELENESN